MRVVRVVRENQKIGMRIGRGGKLKIVVATKRDGLHSMFCIILFVQCFQSRSSEPELEILMSFFSPGLDILNPSALRSNVPVSGYKPPSGTHIRIPNHSKYFIAEFLSL